MTTGNGSKGHFKEPAQKEQSDAGTAGRTHQRDQAGGQPLGNRDDAAEPRAAQSPVARIRRFDQYPARFSAQTRLSVLRDAAR